LSLNLDELLPPTTTTTTTTATTRESQSWERKRNINYAEKELLDAIQRSLEDAMKLAMAQSLQEHQFKETLTNSCSEQKDKKSDEKKNSDFTSDPHDSSVPQNRREQEDMKKAIEFSLNEEKRSLRLKQHEADELSHAVAMSLQVQEETQKDKQDAKLKEIQSLEKKSANTRVTTKQKHENKNQEYEGPPLQGEWVSLEKQKKLKSKLQTFKFQPAKKTSGGNERKVQCPVGCLRWISETTINQHVDECLTHFAS